MPAIFGDTAAALVVDDDEQMARLLSRLLAAQGYRCTWAATAAEARAFLGEGDYALALVDVMMPDETGLELVDWMLAEHDDVAVVMVTGIDDPRIAELALESGVHGYVVKPFQPSQLIITVAIAGRQRCLEIERRLYQERIEGRPDRPDA
jgi:DNA-binding response OmpR family regulator